MLCGRFFFFFELTGKRWLNEITPIVCESGSTPAVSLRAVYQALCLCRKSWLMMYSALLTVELRAQLNMYCAQLCGDGELMKTNMRPLSGSRYVCGR